MTSHRHEPTTAEYVRSAFALCITLAELIDKHGREDLRPLFDTVMFDLTTVAKTCLLLPLIDMRLTRH
ncbi:MAG: hypothetical protein WC655_10395 [Candidatus Hydrogenedentales bacterium]